MVTEREVIDYIKRWLLLVRLELEDKGFRPEQISDNELLLDDSGLKLDSLEALDLVVGLEQKYGTLFDIPDEASLRAYCHSVSSLAGLVVNRLNSPVN